MSKLKVLYVCHNHPDLHPGGTEIFAHDLFTEIKRRPGVEAIFLACTDNLHRKRRPGTLFQTIGSAPDEFLIWTGHFDRFFQSQIDLHAIVPELTDLLQTFRPDIVHFHHSLLIGVETLFLVKRILPAAKICFTLHEYYAICANDGQMVTIKGALCERASADACGKCFPNVPQDQFALREQYIKTLFSQVDRFVAPSRFLMGRFVEWGLAAERIELLRNGLPAISPAPHRVIGPGAARNRFGFFGHINRFKGAVPALEAAARLGGEADFALSLHGGVDFQTEAFQETFRAAVERCPQARYRGPYRRGEMPELMADMDWVIVPSVWWENAPLVINEAFAHGRPVICGNIGGMAEAVRDGIDGLHFRAGDPDALAAAMRRALGEPGLWERLVEGIEPPWTIGQSTDEHFELYERLLAKPARRARTRLRVADAA